MLPCNQPQSTCDARAAVSTCSPTTLSLPHYGSRCGRHGQAPPPLLAETTSNTVAVRSGIFHCTNCIDKSTAEVRNTQILPRFCSSLLMTSRLLCCCCDRVAYRTARNSLKGKSETGQGGTLSPPPPPPPRGRVLLRQQRPSGRSLNNSSSSRGDGKSSATRGASLHHDTAPLSRRTSPSWHHREKLDATHLSYGSSRDTSLVVDGPLARRSSGARGSNNGGTDEKQAGLSGESIDAEELFRRKKKVMR